MSAVQNAAGVPADGIVGPQTWPHLVISTQNGSTGDAVRAVQQFGLVPSPGLDPLVVDGDFGPITEERVRFFQESWGLTQDGIAGRETWSFFSTFQPGAATVAAGEGGRDAERRTGACSRRSTCCASGARRSRRTARSVRSAARRRAPSR